MSLQPLGARGRQNMFRELAYQAAAHPRMEAAIMGAVRAELPGIIEELLRQSHGGRTVQLYVARTGSLAAKDERDRRIRSMAAAPTSMAPSAIAAQEGITVRRVQQILRKIPPL